MDDCRHGNKITARLMTWKAAMIKDREMAGEVLEDRQAALVITIKIVCI